MVEYDNSDEETLKRELPPDEVRRRIEALELDYDELIQTSMLGKPGVKVTERTLRVIEIVVEEDNKGLTHLARVDQIRNRPSIN